jgi:HEPN domain-containing protein
MMDIGKQVAYWKQSAEEDWAVARQLVKSRRIRHGLFFAHLSLEKLLKALVCRHCQDLAPKIHNLPRLAELAGVGLSPERLDILSEMNAFQIEGRYPDALTLPPTVAEARDYLKRAEEVYEWLINQL